MVRTTLLILCLLLSLLLPLGCDGSPQTPSTTSTEGDPASVGAKAPESPPTGIVVAQRDQDEIAQDMEDWLAKPATERDAAEPALFLQRIDILLTAGRIAMKGEAKQLLQQKRAQLSGERFKLNQTRTAHFVEIGEIQSILSEFEKGVGSIPKGFTEAELRDQVADLREGLRGLDKTLAGIEEEIGKCEDTLNHHPDAIPHPGETLWAREVEALLALRAKAEALP